MPYKRKTLKRQKKSDLMGGKDQYFHFRRTDNHPEVHFDGKLKSVPCKGKTKKGASCKRHSVIGTPYCREHLRKILKLAIRKSDIPNAGNGLFAEEAGKLKLDANGSPHIVFHAGDIITEYDVQRINKAEVDKRYGVDDLATGPYVVRVPIYGTRTVKRGRRRVEEQYRTGWSYLDGGTERGVGSLANQAMVKADNNAELKNENGALEATKDIVQGQEIFVDYGDEFGFDGPYRYSTNFSKYHI